MWAVARILAHALDDAPAVENRHLEVEEDDAGRLDGDAPERQLAVPGLLHRVAGLGEHLAEGLAEVVVVVDDQDGLARGHAAASGAPWSVATISRATRRASSSRSGSRETAPTTGWPPPP